MQCLREDQDSPWVKKQTLITVMELLRKLQFAYCTHIPYENLDIMRGIPLSLEEDALFDKIVTRGQGGFCF